MADGTENTALEPADPAFEQADTFEQAGTFELTGGGATINFDSRSGELHYRGPSRPPLRDFLEVTETVEPEDTAIGRLVTATLRAAEDGDSSTITALLPRVNLRDRRVRRVRVAGGVDDEPFEHRRARAGRGRGAGLHAQDHAGDGALGDAARPCQFTAVHDREPPGPAVLRVTGSCTFNTAGFTVELCRHEPQGINPRDLLLDLTITPPDDVAAQVITTVEVVYKEQTEAEFDTVTILPDGISVPVQTVV